MSIWGADLIKVAIQSNVAEIKVGFAGDLNSLPNVFSVALVFFNESEAKVRQISYIDNIKSTTPGRQAHTARVMLPGQGDDYYPPPPPVKTQMGDITAKVPAGSDMLYLVIMGKGPADLPDSMLSWSGKATYRIDIEVTASHPAPAAALRPLSPTPPLCSITMLPLKPTCRAPLLTKKPTLLLLPSKPNSSGTEGRTCRRRP